MTIQSNSITLIPLDKLVPSPRNVRRKDRKADIDALAASIASRGLLQNLCVVSGEDDRFEVDAGGRRLAALKQLARKRIISRTFPVPCHVVAVDQGREVSLTENVHRVSMDAMDEVDAFAALVADGASVQEIAHRFGVTHRHVEQRLALANLSPKIKAAWKRGDVSLEAARAFCLVDDHARQEAVYRSLGRPVTHPASVRARLMEGAMRATDRIAIFVGLEAYEAAGGAAVRDLFDADAVFIGDPALMTQLAEQKLQASADAWLADGWGWVEVCVDRGRGEGLSSLRLQPDWRVMTDDEQVELDRLRAEIDALDTALEEDSVDDDPRWDTRDALTAAVETLRQSTQAWDTDLMALTGVVLSISHEGHANATLGLVRMADEKAVRARQRAKASTDNARHGSDLACEREAGAAVEEVGGRLPKGVIRDLSRIRTAALRFRIAEEPNVALALAVAGMISCTQFGGAVPGIGVSAHSAVVDDLDDTRHIRDPLFARLPGDEGGVLAWCLRESPESLLSILAVLVAGSIDLTHEKGTPSDRARANVARKLVSVFDLDMRKYWQPNHDYWTRLPKTELIAAFADSPAVLDLNKRERDAVVAAHAKLKKDDLVNKVAHALDGVGYLPDLFINDVEAGSLVVAEPPPALVAAE